MTSTEGMKCIAIVGRTDSSEATGKYLFKYLMDSAIAIPKDAHYIEIPGSIVGPPPQGHDDQNESPVASERLTVGLWIKDDDASDKVSVYFYPITVGVRGPGEEKPEGIRQLLKKPGTDVQNDNAPAQ